ncbi:hypothetical protein FNF27_03338 [Cafeteria roenbergensis]|uniref:Reverse transcriptase domain-containing protein n=1 Tax=Cafeteria roenbergensis TaxID=33653 RepID=A0A5A8EGH3_CAFRO|nr:hypothetical protein FNF27_03338 [Cafeteria roenbergensis]
MDASHGLEGDDAEDVTGAMAEAGGNETPLSDGERACGDGRCKRCSTSSPDSLAKGAFLRHGCPSKKWVQWYIKALLRQCTFGEAFAADKLRQRKAVSDHVPVALEPTLQHGTMAAAASLAGAGRRGNAEGHPTVEQAAGIRVQLTTVAALKAYLRRQNGTSAKDLAKSMASAGTVAQDRETLEALMDLHPSEDEVIDGTVEGEAPDLTDSELREMVSAAIQSMPHKKAVGPDGMVAKQLENIAEKDLDALVSFVRRALRNDLSAEERRVLGSSTLMAIPKGNGKIRPVAMVSGLGKLVGKVVNTILGKHGLLDQLRFQFLGCRDGSCRLVHAVRTAFEEGEIRTVVVALDMANAYNSVSRRAMIEEVRRLDEKLVPAVLALYGSSSPLLFATDEGEVFELKSNRGVRQGDPAAGALFAIAVHPLVDEVRRAFPDVLILQMADDTTLVGPRKSAFRAAQMLAERLSTVGLRMNTSKTQVLCKRGQLERTKARIQREMKRSRDDPGSPPSVLEGCHLTERSVAVLQCPVGEELPPEVALEHSMKRLEKEFGPAAERLLAGIEVCGLKRAHHLLLSVVGQKFSYLHRAAGAAAGQELAVFHAALLANLSAVAHKTELDAIGHALSDEMCTVTEDGFREAMSKAIEALVRGLPDEHARREAWWALLGREADGVTRLASAASNPALKKGGYAQMRLAKMLSKGCKAGGMGLPGVAQFRFEATAGFIEAVRDMRKGRFEMAPPPEEALDGPGTDRSDATKEVGDILLRCEEVAKGAYRDYERDSKEYKDACTEARYFRPDKDCVVGKEADLHAARVKKRYQLAHVWRSDIAGAVEGLEELRAEIEELALEAMMELRSDDESSDDMEATANLVEEFIRACKGARCLAAATGFEGFLPDTLGKLPGELKAKLRKCLYGDGVTARANEQTEAPWQRKMVLHHDDMLRIKHECVFLRRLAKARRACTARCRAEALAKGTPEKRVANIDDPAMLRVMSDLVAFREACVPGTHYWLRNTMMGPRGLTDEEFAVITSAITSAVSKSYVTQGLQNMDAFLERHEEFAVVVTRYRIGASEADHVVPDGVSINCACVQRDTTARGTVHIGGITSAVSKSYVTQGLQSMDAFLERREELPPEVALEHSMKRLEKEFGPAAERLLAGIEVCGLKRAHHLLLSVVGQKFSYLHRAAGAAAGQELAVFHAALLANLAAVAHKTELDAIGHALSDEMCTVTEDGFREAMSKAIEALVRGLPDEHARREAWWALLGREADGVTRLASAASNPALKKGGYAQMRLAKMLSRGCKAGGMGLPGVAQFRFEATAGFIEAVRDMRKGRFEMAPPPEEALDGPGTGGGGGEAASGSGAGAGPANAGEAEAEDESGAAAAAAGGTPWVDHPAVGESESKEDCEEGPAHGQQLAGTLDGWLVSGTGGAAEPGHQPTPTSGGQTGGGGAAAASAAGAATEMTTGGGGAAAASAAGAPTGQETSDAAQPRADAAQVYSVRRTPAIGLARDGPDADADGNDPNWKGISLKKLVRSSLKRSDRSDATKEVGDILLRCEEVAKGAYRDYERDSKEYKDACTEARYFRPDKDCVVGKEADLHAARVKKRYQLAHVWRSDIAGAVEGLEELRAEIEELALEAMMELRSDDESSDDMEATANLVEEFIRACKGARCLAAATGFEGFLPDTLGKLPGELKAKLRKCLYGDGVTARANEQTEAPWQRKMVLHHDDMLRIKHECVFLRRLAKARRACTARCRAEALAKGTPEKRVANIDDPAMLRVMSDLVAFREACVPGTHYWLRNTMMGPRGLTDEEFAVVERYRIGASEADHVVPDGVSINCACVQGDTTARGTVHIGGVSGVAHHLARCRCGKGSTIRAHNDVRDVLHAAITSAVSKSYVTQGLQSMDAFLERPA